MHAHLAAIATMLMRQHLPLKTSKTIAWAHSGFFWVPVVMKVCKEAEFSLLAPKLND
jgi:hypothetical protein